MKHLSIGARLGRGGQGEVYAAVTDAGVEVAVKRLNEDPGTDAVRRLAREARLLACAEHSGIVKPLALVRLHGELALVTELAPGADLGRLVAVRRPPPGAALALVAEVAEILAEAAEAPGPDGAPLGLVHRDVRTANVVVAGDGRPRLLDLGIGQVRRSRSSHTASGQQLGALETLAPEAFLQGEDTPARDVFSLAAMAVVLLSGEGVYGKRTSRQVASLAASEARCEARMADAVRGLPAGDALLLALAREPSSRPTAARLAERLARAALRGGGSAAAWARLALAAVDPLPNGAWTGRCLSVAPSGFAEVDDLSTHRRRPVGAADPTVKVRREDEDSTVVTARTLPTRRTPVDEATSRLVEPRGGGAPAQARIPVPLLWAAAVGGLAVVACCSGWGAAALSGGLG